MADWYVYQHDGDPLGPWSTDAVAEAMLAGKLAPDVLVAAPGGARWLRALDVPVIARLVEGIPTRPRRRDSGLRLVTGGFTAADDGQPQFGSTMMIVKDDELRSGLDEPATTRKGLPVSSRRLDDTAEMTARPAMSFQLADEDEEEAEAVTRHVLPIDRDRPSSDPHLPPSSTPIPPTRSAAAEPEQRRRSSG
ncbi:hypothetical protein BH11MYX4_BH11MYX4_07040 [soil metagenome]